MSTFEGVVQTDILPFVLTLIQALLPIITQLVKDVLPIVLTVLKSIMPIIKQLIETVLPILKTILETLTPVIQVLASIFSGVLGASIKTVTEIINGVLKTLKGLIDFITGVFTGNWKQAWDGVKGIFGGIFESLAGLVKAPINAVIGIINGAIEGLNKIGFETPDWLPFGLGGKKFGVDIKNIPYLEKGSNYTPDNFIAGDVNGKGGELITNARGRKVFTAAQTGKILHNINAINTILPIRNHIKNSSSGVNTSDIFKNLQSTLSVRKLENLNAPTLSVPVSRGETPITVHYEQTIHVDGNAPHDLEEKLRKSNEHLIEIIEERFRSRAENERRMVYS